MKIFVTFAAPLLANTTRRTFETNDMLNLYSKGLEVGDLTMYGCNCFEVSSKFLTSGLFCSLVIEFFLAAPTQVQPWINLMLRVKCIKSV